MKEIHLIGSGLREPLLGIFRHLKRHLERRRNIEQLLELAEAITDYAQMTQSQEGWREQPPQYVIVGIQELAFRFRETPRTIKDALLVLNLEDIANPLPGRRYWKVKLSEIPIRRGDEKAA